MEDEKKNYIPAIIIIIFVFVLVLLGGLTNYKSETLVCSRIDDTCLITKTNLFNMESETPIVRFSEINSVTYYAQRVKGNRYGKGYREYFIAFSTDEGEKVKIFSKSYYEKSELNNAIKELQKKLDASTDKIIFERGE